MKPAPNAPSCPECEHGPQTEPVLGRRDFIRVVGASAAVAAVGGLTPLQIARAARAEKQAQAEAMVFELFGTLDADSLETVAATVESLAGAGRMVGIVTHVRELAERVPVRYVVSKGPRSASVTRVVA